MKAKEADRSWHIVPVSRTETLALARALGVAPLVAQVLLARGVGSPLEGRRFLKPSLDHVTDPFLLADMDVAVNRLEQAVARGERVLVFGDYDVDGIAGTAILVQALRRLAKSRAAAGWTVAYDMPNRLTEGFGLSPQRVHKAQQEDFGMIVAVDNGVSAIEAGDAAKALGIDLIVLDHHKPQETLPQAVAVVNPFRHEAAHPAAHACGAVLAYKLACALTQEQEDLDLVALGAVADVVPLRGENRDLVAAGLEYAARFPRLGLEALARTAGLELGALKAEDIAYQIAPRINAAGRLADGRVGVELLLTESPAEAGRLARMLAEANERRRILENRISQEAEARLIAVLSEGRHSIVLGSRAWHPGVVGIVAARLQSRYQLPVVLVAFDEAGLGRGSARAGEGCDLTAAFEPCRDHLLRFGGHRSAAGLVVEESRFEAFAHQFEAAVAALPLNIEPSPLRIDALVSLSELDGRMVSALEQLQPFGCGNPPPVFCTYGAEVLPNSCRELRGGHLRMTVREGSRLHTAVGFGMGELLPELAQAGKLDIVFTPELHSWQGETGVRLKLKTARPAQ